MQREQETRDRAERATRRYLELLRDALLDEHYLENELRIQYLLEGAEAGKPLDPVKLADPARHLAVELDRLRLERRGGRPADALAYADMGRIRLQHLEECLDALRADDVAGDLVDAGTGRGGAAILMRGYLEAHEIEGPRVLAADPFNVPPADPPEQGSRFPADLNAVREGFARFHLLDERVLLRQGPPAEALAEAVTEPIALLRASLDEPAELRALLDALYDAISPGGFVIIECGSSGCRMAVEAFRRERAIDGPLQEVDWDGVAWRKPFAPDSKPTQPVARPAERETVPELGVVVVVHNMRREARRTLHSLSRAYQRGIEDLAYEVVVVENGSDPDLAVDEDFVRGFGPEFRYLDLAAESTPSPAPAVNRGIEASTARNLALMIDGAHVLTPGVLRHGMLGLSAYAPAVVSTKHWYLGPGQQPEAVAAGYDQQLEDRLFDEIRWPADGYRLFEIGHFIGDRDWFDGDWESNCVFVPRLLLDQVGGMDELFTEPGGGFVNLDFFERMIHTPGVNLVSIIGEASFHQVHGGTTTNADEPFAVVGSFRDRYEEIRGRPFIFPPQKAKFVGSLSSAARRSKARRMQSFGHFGDAQTKAAQVRPEAAMPVPQDLKAEFTDAFWRSGEWHGTSWLGRWAHRPPTDLFAYQELIFKVRPDWIIETRTGTGGRALFLASICDLLGSGEVISIDGYPPHDPPEHPRITYLRGDPAIAGTAERVKEVTGEQPRAMVVLGAGARTQLLDAIHNFATFVPIGSYLVVEDTILDGHLVWPEFGDGPRAAVNVTIDRGEFVPDPMFERYGVTFNARGFLKRVR